MSGVRFSTVRREFVLIASLVSLLIATPAAAQARTPPRQIASDHLTTMDPGTPQGDKLSIDFVNPGDPSGKPFSVESFVLTFHPGTVIDTSVPEQCRATDAELIAFGPEVCPPGSKIGSGKTEVDTGLVSSPAFPRIVKLDISIFNNEREVLNVTESTNTPTPIRTIVRNPINGTSVRTKVPPIPAVPPPDPFIALKSVRVTIDPVVRGGQAYRLSPPTCPRSGTWRTRLTFNYRDGVSETVDTPSPCRRDGPPPVDDGGGGNEPQGNGEDDAESPADGSPNAAPPPDGGHAAGDDDGGGELPFTGFAVVSLLGVGAASVMTGFAVRRFASGPSRRIRR